MDRWVWAAGQACNETTQVENKHGEKLTLRQPMAESDWKKEYVHE